MKITPPIGDGEIVPLQKTDRVPLPAGGTPAFCRGLNALALSYLEFAVAARDYPIMGAIDAHLHSPANFARLDAREKQAACAARAGAAAGREKRRL